MKKSLLTFVIIAALPFGAMAENISGAMYTAPATADTNHPAPTTQANAPYGRANIDTADQEHIATTAYVKGAYNSAIAAVNKVNDNKQDNLFNPSAGLVSSTVFDTDEFLDLMVGDYGYDGEERIISGAAVLAGIKSQQVKIYTTWDDDSDSATTHVLLDTILPDDD